MFGLQVECWTWEHILMVVTASVYIPLVLIGLPAFIGWRIIQFQRSDQLHDRVVYARWAWVHDAFEVSRPPSPLRSRC